MNEEPGAPPAELLETLQAERRRLGPPAEVKQRLIDRLDGLGAPAGAPSLSLVPVRTLGFGLVMFVAGAIAGAAMQASQHPRKAAALVVIAPSPAQPEAAAQLPELPAEPDALQEEEPSEPAAPPAAWSRKQPLARVTPQPSPASAPASDASSSLEAERRLLEPARVAIARGNVPAALVSLRKHEADFPAGTLAEEREALWVQALSSDGQGEEALQRAQAFRRTFPGSFLLPVVDAAVSRTP